MPSSITLQTNDGSTVTTYHLAGAGAAYTGSGTPWTSQTTSPIEIGMNDLTGEPWTPLAAPTVPVRSGGPPYVAGQRVLAVGYDNIVQTIPIQIRADTHNNAVAVLQRLRRGLKLARFATPSVLGVQPDGASNTVYYDIYDGEIQESARFINEEAGRGLLRCTITIECSPTGSTLNGAETLLNGVTFTNQQTNNTQAFSTGAGDLIYEGSPINLMDMDFNATPENSTVYMATVQSVVNITGSGSLSTTSTTGLAHSTPTVDLSAAQLRAGLKARVMWRITSATSNLEVRARLRRGDSTLYTGPWVGGRNVTTLYDLGGFPLDWLRTLGNRTDANTTWFSLDYRSNDGASATGGDSYGEILLYYTFARVTSAPTAARYLSVASFPARANVATLPYPAPLAFYSTSTGATNEPTQAALIIGTAPRYYAGASLYLAGLSATGLHTTTEQYTVTATHAPQWRTLRGNT